MHCFFSDAKTLHVNPSKLSGWLLLEKPCGLTSAAVVRNLCKHLRHSFKKPIKIGHGGTLDPFANGLLPVAIGEATKTSAYMMDHVKTYRFQIRWGISTDTQDREGSITKRSNRRPSKKEIESALPHFTGKIMQTPPAYCACKVNGKRAYALAREGKPVILPKREVCISSFNLIDMLTKDLATFEITCSKGTYVRTVAQDLAVFLASEGHLVTLSRLVIGSFKRVHSLSLEKALSLSPEKWKILPAFIPLDIFLRQTFSTLKLDGHQALKLLQGKPLPFASVIHHNVPVDNFSHPRYNRKNLAQNLVRADKMLDANSHNPPHNTMKKNLVATCQQEAIAIVHIQDGLLRTKCVFHHRKKPIYMKGMI